MTKSEERNRSEEFSIPNLLKKVPNRFLLSVAAAKRSKQLKEGVKPLVEVPKDGEFLPLEVALQELWEEKVKVVIKDAQEEDEVIDELDQILEAEIEESKAEKEEEKKGPKEKGRSKSKSLAA